MQYLELGLLKIFMGLAVTSENNSKLTTTIFWRRRLVINIRSILHLSWWLKGLVIFGEIFFGRANIVNLPCRI